MASIVVLVATFAALCALPAAAADHRGVGRAVGGWAAVTQHGEGLVARLGVWLVQVTKVLTGETGDEPTSIGGGMDPTNSGEANTDPVPGVLTGSESGS